MSLQELPKPFYERDALETGGYALVSETIPDDDGHLAIA